ncbi:carbohydrate ABC transporter permease [Streptomyces sp. NPDC021020]|uniref:carbohydrate ABC transporter permease n=1 Tax=Streptomyces sp. NPDC021020 TaxID=3365109 RepID=UPI0037BA7BAC
MASVLDNETGGRVAPPGGGPGPRLLDRRRRRDTLAAVAFLTPSMVAFTLFVILPALGAFGLSFFDWDLFGTPRWVGLDNFSRLFQDSEMWDSLRVTVEFVVLGVIPTIVIGFVLAVLINSRMRGIGALRILYFAPMVASSAVAAVLWSYMYDDRAGVVNRVLGWVGIDGPAWLSSTTWALPALTVMMIWLGLPLVMILYLAGLQRIPADIYAAASLDGAGRWRQLWSITWPNVGSTTVLVATLQLINFVSGSFEVSLIMTNGGPLGHTQSLALYAYQTAFHQTDMGYASALSLFQLVLIALVVGLIRLITRMRRTA